MYSLFSAMAGNIIPAIATTNAVVAALIVMEALKVLSGRIQECKTVSFGNLHMVEKDSLRRLQLTLCRQLINYSIHDTYFYKHEFIFYKHKDASLNSEADSKELSK